MKTCGLRKKSLLVVDDNQGIQIAISKIAEDIGFSVFRASDRNSAIELIERQAFDVAIVDKRLVEHDKSNADGLAILNYINSLNEGTYKILMTGYGEYEDAVEVQKYGVQTMKKNSDSLKMVGDLRDALIPAIEVSTVGDKNENHVALYCGEKDPSVWMYKVSTLLKPTGNVNPIIDSVERLIKTCVPLRKCNDFSNIIMFDSLPAVVGLFWSRGLGTSCILTLSRDLYIQKDDIPKCDGWPDTVTVGDIIYKAKNKNIYSTIIKCTGLNHEKYNITC